MGIRIKYILKLLRFYLKQIFIKENYKRFFSDIINTIKLFINDIKSLSLKDFSFKLLPITLYKMLFKSFFSWFLVAQSLFILILLIVDLFFKLNDYVNYSVNIFNILNITCLYIPKAISLTIPVAIMFGITMSLGSFYQNNELVAIFTSGISIFKFTMPLIIFNFFLSFGMIFINANAVIPIERFRLDYYEQSTKKNASGKYDNQKITIRGENNYFWNVQKFISSQNIIQKIILFKIDEDYHIIYRLDAMRGKYTEDGWVFYTGIIREWDEKGILKNETKFQKKTLQLPETPYVFKKQQYDIDNMTILEAKERIAFLKKLNIDYNKELTAYYKKFSFPFTLLIVALFAIGVATISRTNVLVLSLFFSVGLAVLYYVMQMIIDVLASTGKIDSFVGAWLTLFIFFPISIFLIYKAKT